MDNLFEIKFSFEQRVKDAVIYPFSNKQGGDFNVFSYHWQCFVWAAIVGFIHNERRPLQPPVADKPFCLNTMINADGKKCAQALVCLCIAKAGTIDIMKEPQSAIALINEYANGGFHYIMNQINGEPVSNDFEWVKQEIFGRNMDYMDTTDTASQSGTPQTENNLFSVSSDNLQTDGRETEEQTVPMHDKTGEMIMPAELVSKAKQRWTTIQIGELKRFVQQGMDTSMLAAYFHKSEADIESKILDLHLRP